MSSHASLETVARWLIAIFFIASGAAKVFAFQPSLAIMRTVGFPSPHLSLIGINTLEIVGGLCLLLGVGTRFVSIALILFLALATIMFHARFIADPVVGPDQFVHMIKNIAIIGGLLVFVAHGTGILARS
jgi:putative oxidoreductase